ncbi:hypothetical protein HanPI659440_Chr11g0434391 [Helianthus annuus]|nr:hypothetical protein HanPI659440_Chr11g0434391 [Helianthus annuus]
MANLMMVVDCPIVHSWCYVNERRRMVLLMGIGKCSGNHDAEN